MKILSLPNTQACYHQLVLLTVQGFSWGHAGKTAIVKDCKTGWADYIADHEASEKMEEEGRNRSKGKSREKGGKG